MNADQKNSPFPEGLNEEHSAPPSAVARHASILSIVILGALMALAFSGVLGGHPRATLTADNAAAFLEVRTPKVIRNGEIFETQIRVSPRRPIADLVVGVTPSLWRQMTVNTMIPAPIEESFKDGYFHFSYGAVEPGGELVVKIDSQINPALFRGTAGRIVLLDRETPIATLPVRVRVLP